jgi:intracellular sulfur oxidation DsrE/DsrF family protein
MRLDMKPVYVVLVCLIMFANQAQAQNIAISKGPVIEGYGPVVDVEADYGFKEDFTYRAVMDISASPDSDAALNRSIESAARFLNMHARAGIKPSNMKLAMVLHGAATKDALSNQAYRSRYETNNPNDGLLEALKEAGVDIYLCGQSAGFSGFQPEELHDSVTMATSAMTVLTRLQVEGWSLLP